MVNKDKIIEGVKLILEGIGEDCSREGLVETPDRIARMYEEIFFGMNDFVVDEVIRCPPVKNIFIPIVGGIGAAGAQNIIEKACVTVDNGEALGNPFRVWRKLLHPKSRKEN